jgi:hypothetical protein
LNLGDPQPTHSLREMNFALSIVLTPSLTAKLATMDPLRTYIIHPYHASPMLPDIA